jgi:uncharacterized protein (TIGR02996 family)
MTTNAAPGLLEELIHHPDDDAPRLILADWWDEWGSPSDRARAELIRLQIQREPRRGEAGPRSTGARRREDQLISLHKDLWRHELPQRGGILWSDDFTRGFVEQFTADSPEAFLLHAPALFAAAPVRSARISGLRTQDDLRRLFGSPWLERLSELDLGCNHFDAAMQTALGEFPPLPRLQSLLLHQTDLGTLGLGRLLQAPGLPRLRELYLAGNEIRDPSLAVLAGAERLANLHWLDLRDNRFGSDGMRLLTQSPALQNLRHLWVINSGIEDSGASTLYQDGVSRLPHLESLWLNWNAVSDRGATTLAQDPARTALRDLDLRHCDIEDEGGLALARSPWLEDLEYLHLTGNRFARATVATLRQRFGRRVRV